MFTVLRIKDRAGFSADLISALHTHPTQVTQSSVKLKTAQRDSARVKKRIEELQVETDESQADYEQLVVSSALSSPSLIVGL